MTEAAASYAPREPGKSETRQALLAAAAEVIATKGYEKASLAEIAKKAGLTTGAVYSTYGSKWELLQAVIGQLMTSTAVEQAERRGEPESADELSLTQMCDLSAEQLHDVVAHADLHKLGALQFETMLLAMRNPSVLELATEGDRARRKANADSIAQKAAAEGHELPLPPEQVATLAIVLSQGLQLAQFIDPDFVTPQLYRDAFRLVFGLPVTYDEKEKPQRKRRAT